MISPSRPTPPASKRLLVRLFRTSKKSYQRVRFLSNQQKAILFAFGAQRSGTTLVRRIFERDFRASVYVEHDHGRVFHRGPNANRLNSLDAVKKVIDRDKAPLIVVKPLAESQNARKILEYFENSKALWLYRHYKDVARSSLNLFGMDSGVKNLRPIVENDPEDWRSENVAGNVRTIVLEHFSEDMNPYDAAALFWFVHNCLFFEQKLDENPNVMLCKYEDLVTDPLETIGRIYDFTDLGRPGERVVAEVHHGSLGKGKEMDLSPAIANLCNELWQELNELNRKQTGEDGGSKARSGKRVAPA